MAGGSTRSDIGIGGSWADVSTVRSRATGALRVPTRSFRPAPAVGAPSSEISLLRSVAVQLAKRRRSRPTWNWSQASSSRQIEMTDTYCRRLWCYRSAVAPTRIAGSIAWNGTRSGRERGHFSACPLMRISGAWFGPLMTDFPSWRLPGWRITSNCRAGDYAPGNSLFIGPRWR